MSKVVLDLETMSTEPNAAIVAIGAVLFDTSGVLDRFYRVVDLESSVAYGGHVSPDTVLWWLEQPDNARLEFVRNTQVVSLPVALQSFSEWLKGMSEPVSEMWGNGVDFDNVILRSAYDRIRLDPPWSYRANRCFRTIRGLFPDLVTPSIGVAHRAVDDAEYQATHLISGLRSLGL